MSSFREWPGESNGKPRTGGNYHVTTPETCPYCDDTIEQTLPRHLRDGCDGGDA